MPPEGSPTSADAEAVRAQLGRPPRGSWTVARRCDCGLPQVIQTQPRLADGSPFPTLWWLTCKKLTSLISRLESDGWMASVNERLANEPALKEQLRTSMQKYVATRDAIEPLGSTDHPGGGPDRVKCLHAHTAHTLVTGDNPIGEHTLEKLGWTDPDSPCV